MKDKVDKIFSIKAIGIQLADIKNDTIRLNLDSTDFDFIYPAYTDFNKFLKVNENQRFFTYDNPKGIVVQVPNTTKHLYILALQPKFNTHFFYTAEILLTIYWMLFAVWASLNALYNKRNRLWIIAFLIFNILGYSFYYAVYSKNKN